MVATINEDESFGEDLANGSGSLSGELTCSSCIPFSLISSLTICLRKLVSSN